MTLRGQGGAAKSSGGLPHGQWRLLGPALLSWGAAAALVHAPGVARWIAGGAALLGLSLVALFVAAPPRTTRQRAARGQRCRGLLRAGTGPLLVSVAALLLITARIDALERGRDVPANWLAEQRGNTVEAQVRLVGFPAATAGFAGEERGWVRARILALGPAPVPATGREPVGEPGAFAGPDPVSEVSVMLWLPETAPSAWHPGTRLCVVGALRRGPPEALSAYELDVKAMPTETLEFAVAEPRRPDGIGCTGTIGAGADGAGVDDAGSTLGRLAVGGAAAQLRAGLRERAAEMPGAQLVPGLAVGDTSLVGDELGELMLDSNLTHLTAVSGSNCALIVAAMAAVTSRLGGGRRLRIVVAAVALGGFVVLVGPDASVQRAAVMAGVLLASRFGGKRGQALPALGLATLVLLLADPWQSTQPGFALSVVATAGILVWATPVEALLRVRTRLPRAVALPLAVAAVAQFSCAPLLLLLQTGLSTGGVLANLLAAPAAPLGTAAGMIALLLLPASATLGGGALWLAVWPARWIEAAGVVGVSPPGARLYWPAGWGGALALTAVYVLGAVALTLGRSGGARHRGWPKQASVPPGRRLAIRAVAGVAAGVTVGVSIAVPATVRFGVPGDWAVAACDVGQGDAVLVRDPERPEQVMLVDTGDDEAALETCLALFGVTRVALLVLSHDHRDHVGALGAVLSISESALVPPESAENTGMPLAERVRRAGVTAVTGEIGMTGGSAPAAAGLGWEVLGPQPLESYPDENSTSLVLRVTVAGVSLLLLGDTGGPEQVPLMREGGRPTADVVKVAHHGSKNQAAGFYDVLGSRVALISVGAENRYGHPNPQLVDTITAAGNVVLRTDELGSVAITVRQGELGYWNAGRRSSAVLRSGTGTRKNSMSLCPAKPGKYR